MDNPKTVSGGFNRPTVVWSRVAPGLVIAVRGSSCTHIDDPRVSQTVEDGPDSGAFRYPCDHDTKEAALARVLRAAGVIGVTTKWVSPAEMARQVPSYRYRWEAR